MKKKIKNFTDYPAKERKRIIEEAVRKANEEQLKVLKEYDKKFGKQNTK